MSDRYYQAYLESLHGMGSEGEQVLTKEEFWKYKQNRVSDIEIGILSGLTMGEAKRSAELRRRFNFDDNLLQFDRLFDDVESTLKFLKSNRIKIFIATLRKEPQLISAVRQFKIDRYVDFRHLFALKVEEQIQNDIQNKCGLFFNAVKELGLNLHETWVIGDSDTDIHAGRLARYAKVIAITRGIRSKEQLKLLKPDLLVQNLNEFKHYLEKNMN